MLYTATIMPFNLTYVDDISDGWQTVDFIVDLLFWIDIFINFISAQYNEE